MRLYELILANKENTYISNINRLIVCKSIIFFEIDGGTKPNPTKQSEGGRKQNVTKKRQNRNKTVTFGRQNCLSQIFLQSAENLLRLLQVAQGMGNIQ
jgi:hypothetical protein